MCKIAPRCESLRTVDYRTGLYDDVGALLGEKTRSGAIDLSCELTQEMLTTLFAELSTPHVGASTSTSTFT